MTRDLGDDLTEQLNSAIVSLNRGKTEEGVGELRDFAKQLKARLKSGKLTLAQEQAFKALISEADLAITAALLR